MRSLGGSEGRSASELPPHGGGGDGTRTRGLPFSEVPDFESRAVECCPEPRTQQQNACGFYSRSAIGIGAAGGPRLLCAAGQVGAQGGLSAPASLRRRGQGLRGGLPPRAAR